MLLTLPTQIMSLKKETPMDFKLHTAAAKGESETISRLLDTGRVHVDCQDNVMILGGLFAPKEFTDGLLLCEKSTPLMLAAANGHFDAVSLLLDHGADISASRYTGTTALYFAVQGGFLEVVELLISRGAPVNSFSLDGATPLFVACQYGYLNIVQLLLHHDAIVNCRLTDGCSPLFIAAQNGHAEIVHLLLTWGCEADGQREDGTTPLWIASQMGHAEVVQLLLRYGVFVDTTRKGGATPLFKACHKGHLSVVQELLKHTPNLHILPNGESALHAAVIGGNLRIIKLLVQSGADVTLKNRDNLSSIDIGLKSNKESIRNYFRLLCHENKIKENRILK